MVVPRATLCILTVATTLLVAACQQSGPTASQAAPTPSASVPASFGVVVGQINVCVGMDYRPSPPPPPHPAGTVVVLRGSATWVPVTAGGLTLTLPTESITAESIPAGGEYRFILPPGSYVIFVPDGGYGFAPGGPITPTGPYANVSVAAGQTTHQDVPDPSIPCR
jgi:hypothetical protein